jgi:hypothetical protein
VVKVLASLGSQLAEQALLEDSFGSFEESSGEDEWDPQVDVVNLPVGSEAREKVVRVLEGSLGCARA